MAPRRSALEVCVCISSRAWYRRLTPRSSHATSTGLEPMPVIIIRARGMHSAKKQRTAAAAPRRAVTTTRRIPRSDACGRTQSNACSSHSARWPASLLLRRGGAVLPQHSGRGQPGGGAPVGASAPKKRAAVHITNKASHHSGTEASSSARVSEDLAADQMASKQ